MKIGIFGLGYVGAVSLACLCRDGHDVVGVDINTAKLDLIRQGKSPIVEEGILELMADVARSGRVNVTDSAASAIASTEISFVCVGTPSLPNGGQDQSAIIRLATEIGDVLKTHPRHHTIVIRSTVEPGTVESVIIPEIEKRSGKSAGIDFSVCFQPEFLREGSSIRDYDNPPMTVVGARDPAEVAPLRQIFGNLPCEFIVTDIRTAETLKYACNAFHALKINFANEIGRVCQAIGSNSQAVMQLLCQDRRLNISPAYLRPGFAFGGSCLPKDLRALLYMARQLDVDVPMLSAILPSNRLHVESAVDVVLSRQERSVGIIGLSFKSGTDDLRESPLVELVERLIGKGQTIRIYDPEVKLSQLLGANKRYIDEVIPHIGKLMCESLGEVIEKSKTIVVGLSDSEILDGVRRLARPDQFVLDLVGMPDSDSIEAEYGGICW